MENTDAATPPTTPRPAREQLREGEKIAYGSGGASGAFSGMGGVYLMEPVFVVMLGLSPAFMGIVGVISRIWDALTDMLMGWISDNTRTRWGRRRPYVFVGAICTALWLPVIWLVNPNWASSTLMAWVIGMSLVLLLFTTMWNIPYQCLLMELTPDGAQRTRVAAYRQYFGTAAWLVMGWSWYLAQHPFFGPGDGTSNLIHGAFWLTVATSVVVLVTGVLPALFCRERHYQTASRQAKTSLRRDMKLTLTNHPFLWLVGCTMLFWLGTQAKGGLAFYTKLYYVCGGDTVLAAKIGGFEGTLSLAIGLICIPFFERLSRRHGKRAALFAVLGFTLLAGLSTIFTYTPRFPWLSMLTGVLLAPANSAVWVLLPSLLGDVIDNDELRTGERRDGSFASVFSWTFKLSQSLAAGLAGWLVVLAGFDSKLKLGQTPETLFTMRVLLVLIPTICIVAALLALRRLALTPAQIEATRAALEARQNLPA